MSKHSYLFFDYTTYYTYSWLPGLICAGVFSFRSTLLHVSVVAMATQARKNAVDELIAVLRAMRNTEDVDRLTKEEVETLLAKVREQSDSASVFYAALDAARGNRAQVLTAERRAAEWASRTEAVAELTAALGRGTAVRDQARAVQNDLLQLVLTAEDGAHVGPYLVQWYQLAAVVLGAIDSTTDAAALAAMCAGEENAVGSQGYKAVTHVADLVGSWLKKMSWSDTVKDGVALAAWLDDVAAHRLSLARWAALFPVVLRDSARANMPRDVSQFENMARQGLGTLERVALSAQTSVAPRDLAWLFRLPVFVAALAAPVARCAAREYSTESLKEVMTMDASFGIFLANLRRQYR